MTECLEWEGCRTRGGYCQRRIAGRLRYVHVLVWEETNGPVPHGQQIMHTCDNPACYLLEHLRLGTQAENIADRDAKGRTARGEKNGRAKLTYADVDDIRNALAVGESQRRIAERYGVAHCTIGRINRGDGWK